MALIDDRNVLATAHAVRDDHAGGRLNKISLDSEDFNLAWA